jgi:FtsZ-interacting cell division protein ZipA
MRFPWQAENPLFPEDTLPQREEERRIISERWEQRREGTTMFGNKKKKEEAKRLRDSTQAETPQEEQAFGIMEGWRKKRQQIQSGTPEYWEGEVAAEQETDWTMEVSEG